ncbi:type II toxin-antitoxin system HicB family antitoxin [Phenylobacterium sp.]|uniref:type II toxin-antitoxin system HicB family antitoxin n=1 Tax=Phenylobacterium sp. TaxID=1871053 RepID=UPI00286AAF14|nr:type II toxin-antitoxin system HicB family antitoxin [Phenylobacterium sp.]
MSHILFVALVTGSRDAGYHASFPDLPDLHAQGRDLGDLLAAARRALTDHLDALANAGEAWPTPTPLESVRPAADAMAIPVDVTVDDAPVRVNISLGERLLRRLDAAAEARGMSRSGFIAQSVRVSLGERNPGHADFEATARRLQEEFGALGRRITESLGPDSAFTRRVNALDDSVFDGVRRAADSVSAAMSRRRRASPPDSTAHDEPHD